MMKMKQRGPVKAAKNEADTSGVVGYVKGTVKFGRQAVSGNVSSRNSMVSANARNKRGGY